MRFRPVICLCLWLFIGNLLTGCRNADPTPTDHHAHTDSLIGHANVLLRNCESRHLIFFLDSAYRHFPAAGPGDRWKKYSQQAHYYLNYEIDAVKAGLYTDSMREVIAADTAFYKDYYAQTLFTEGDLLLTERHYNEAFEQYYKGLLFARANLDSCSISRFSNQLGLVKYRQGKYADALPYLKRSFAEYRYCDEKVAYLYHSVLNTIALCFQKSGRLDSAVFNYNRALGLLQPGKSGNDSVYIEASKGVIYGNLGGVYSEQKKFGQAEDYLRKSVAINNRPGYEMGDAITAEIKLCKLYLETRQYPKADSVTGQVAGDLDKQQARHQTDYDLRLQWFWLRWQLLEQTGKIPGAYAASKRYYNLKDSVETVTWGLQEADMEAAFQANRQQQKLALLSRDNEIKRLSLRTTIVLVVIAVVIILVIVISLKRSRKQNYQLQTMLGELNASQLEVVEKTHFLQGLLNNLPVILYQINPDGIITNSMGAGLKAVPGWSNDQLVGVDAFSLASDMVAAFNKAMQGDAVRAINAFNIEDHDFYFDTIVLPDSTRPGGIIGFAVDITAAKRTEKEMVKQSARLEELNGFKDKLLTVMSHDLRQPFSAIMMASEVLKLTGKELSKDELTEIMHELRDTAAKSIGLLEGLLWWVQTEKEDFKYKPQPISLHDNVDEANGIYIYSQQQNQVSVINQIPEDLTVLGHHQMLLFINRNLVSNATKYSPQNGSIQIYAEEGDSEVIVSVVDQGPGMDAAQLEKLFRVQNGQSPDLQRGAGIALSICYDMMQQMGGRIWAESEPGKGSKFCYALPGTLD